MTLFLENFNEPSKFWGGPSPPPGPPGFTALIATRGEFDKSEKEGMLSRGM